MRTNFTFKYNLRQDDFDCFDHILPSSILDICQNIATKHTKTYGLSYEFLKEKNLAWILINSKIDIYKNVTYLDELKVITYPKAKGLVNFEREFKFLNANNELCISVYSNWIIYDFKNNKIIPAKHFPYTSLVASNFIYDKVNKLKDFNCDNTLKYQYQVNYCDIDHNNHLNNSKYALIILNALSFKNKEIIKSMQIDYLNQIFKDDIVNVYYYKEDNIYYLKGMVNNKTNFLAKVII